MKKILSVLLIFVFMIGGISMHGNIALVADAEQSISAVEQGKNALVIGGTSGLGLAIAKQLKKQGYNLIIVGRHQPDEDILKLSKNDKFIRNNLVNEDISFLDNLDNINILIFDVGCGRISSLSDISDAEILNNFRVYTDITMQIIKKYYHKIVSEKDFYTAVVSNIAADVNSPLNPLLDTNKTELDNFVKNINMQLSLNGSTNRILNVAPGCVGMLGKDKIDVKKVKPIVKNVLKSLFAKDEKAKLKIGYLSGTFDLFHIGHLNILRNAKKQCDYLVVGVCRDGNHKNIETFIPLIERMDIVRHIKYVDECVVRLEEDCDVFDSVHYEYLFIGNDYKGSERFNRYEQYFADKNVEIIYLPYTKSTSSTQLRKAITDMALQNSK